MDVQRLLRFLGAALFALTIITGLLCPPGLLPSIVSAGLACATAVVFLLVVILTLIKKRSASGLVQAFIYSALVLALVGGAGSYFMPNEALVEISPNETIVCNDEGYTVRLDEMSGNDIKDASFNVVLTRPDQVSFHETIHQTTPLKIDGISIHPMEYYDDYAIFLIEQDPFGNVIFLGGILFLVGLGLMALPTSRKREVK